MTQEQRTDTLLYLRQKFGDFRTNPHSPSYGAVVNDIYRHLLSKYAGELNQQQAANDARSIVDEICVQGKKDTRGACGSTGQVDSGYKDTIGRIASAVRQYKF